MKKYILKIWPLILGQVLCNMMCTIMAACLPFLQKELFDKGIKNASVKIVFIIIVLYAVCNIVDVIFAYFDMLFTWKGNVRFEMLLKKDFFKSVFKMPFNKFARHDVGDYISMQGNNITSIEQDYLQPSVDIVRSLSMFVIYGVILFTFIDWRMGLTILLTSLLTVIGPKITGKVMSQKNSIYLNQMGVYVTKIKDLMEGFKLIQTRTRENITHEHERVLHETARKRYEYGKYKTLSLSVSALSVNIIKIASFIAAAILLLKGDITIGTGVAAFGYVSSFLDPIDSILYDINSIQSTKSIKEKFLKCVDVHEEKALPLKKSFEKSIVLDHVNFKYKNFEVKDICCTFEKGKKYALIGHSGSGKSTLISIIMKYLVNGSGNVLIDGNDIHALDTSDVICCINQNAHVFADDYMNNATIFSSYPKERVSKIIQMLNIDIMKPVMEKKNCQDLSGGEKQALSLLRMLTEDAPVFLLDEPFSATDQSTTEKLENALLSLEGKTVVMITHKINKDLNKFDKIILMQHGKIVQEGTYDEVKKTEEFKILCSALNKC